MPVKTGAKDSRVMLVKQRLGEVLPKGKINFAEVRNHGQLTVEGETG
jgi:hypothetical protein